MHEMMDAVHGRGTSQRMHRVEGAEEMMERGSKMMRVMEGMGQGMMDEMTSENMSGMMDMMQP